ncbi:PREDICTED: allatostatin-A receptor-like [Branchiostoma belcheri]|uniref:Allatostatin-A receptor-like n=1 Tax=Branchiostoma belcheri TaxID=7741 RepID=A0A6P4YUY3_BRABE|nr:PREDICTED: allatostatin-A receptor-like [Branchiostoma belcheri]
MADVTYIANISRCCISAVGMLANLLILFIVARYAPLRTIHNLYVANLAVADCCFCMFVIVQAAVSIRYRHLQSVLVDMVDEHCRQSGDINSTANFTTVSLTDFESDVLELTNCTEVRVDEESFSLLGDVEEDYVIARLVSDRSCDVGRVIAVFLAASSIFHLIAIACERYQAVTKPFTHRFNTTARGAAKTCVKIWIGAFLTAVLDTVERNIISRDWTFSYKSLYECVYLKPDDPDSGYPYRALQFIIFIISYIVPACILIPVYAMIFYTLRRQRRKFATGRQSVTRFAARRMTSKHHAIPMLFIVTVFFLVCWLPFHITSFSIHSYADGQNIAVVYVATALAVLNSVINPFLYAFIGRNFRKHIAKLFCRKTLLSSGSDRTNMRMSNLSVFTSRNSGISNGTETTTA